MKFLKLFFSQNKSAGFSVLELLISIILFSLILMAVLGTYLSMSTNSAQAQVDREVQENARNILDSITYEIRSANSIYTPTTTSGQLSLETTRYVSAGDRTTFIDFFRCATSVCMRTDSATLPLVINSKNIWASALTFTQINNGGKPSVKVDLTLNYLKSNSTSGNIALTSTVTVSSTASPRSY